MAQSQVIGAFFYGYIVSQVPGGRLAEMFGAKLIFAVSLGAIAVLNLLVDFTYMLYIKDQCHKYLCRKSVQSYNGHNDRKLRL